MIKFFWCKNLEGNLITTKFALSKLNHNNITLKNPGTMSNERKSTLSQVMKLAWQFVKRNGFNLSTALKAAWANIKLKIALTGRIVKFYFSKVDGTIREAYGTLNADLIPGNDNTVSDGPVKKQRKPNDTVQTYFDTERQEWRCFKKANLLRMA